MIPPDFWVDLIRLVSPVAAAVLALAGYGWWQKHTRDFMTVQQDDKNRSKSDAKIASLEASNVLLTSKVERLEGVVQGINADVATALRDITKEMREIRGTGEQTARILERLEERTRQLERRTDVLEQRDA